MMHLFFVETFNSTPHIPPSFEGERRIVTRTRVHKYADTTMKGGGQKSLGGERLYKIASFSDEEKPDHCKFHEASSFSLKEISLLSLSNNRKYSYEEGR